MIKRIADNCYLGIVSGRDSSGAMANLLPRTYPSSPCDGLSDDKE